MKKLLFSFRIILLITIINPAIGQSLIQNGSVWKYLDNGSDQGTDWKAVEFNDSDWTSGTAILGYGTINAGAISTILSYGGDSSKKYTTTYLRSKFDYTPSGDETKLEFNLLVVDGAVVYINGKEVFRINMPSGTINYKTLATSKGNESVYQKRIIPIENITLESTNIIAVEIHKSAASNPVIAWDLEISSNNNSSVPSPNISQIRFGSTGGPLNGLTVTWENSGVADLIAWGYTSNMNGGRLVASKRMNPFGKTLFEYTFPTLQAGTTIYYALFDSKDGKWTETKTFNTASNASNNQFSFTVLGDSRSYPNDWKTIAEATIETDFTLFMGDIINDGAVESGWIDWFEYGKKFVDREPIYHCIGNHDEDNSSSGFDTYLSLLTLPGEETYYSFNYGNAIFICLNTEDSGNTEQYSWLLSTLEANKNQTWKIVFFHRPFYTAPSHTGEMNVYFNTLWKAFDDYGVDMIFNGHTHNYQRSKPINRNVSTTSSVAKYGSLEGMGRVEIVAGNAGAPLSAAASSSLWWLERSESKRHFCNVDIDGDRLIFKALDANRVIFDELILDKNISGITDLRVNKSIVYPNPTEGELTIENPSNNEFSYSVYTITGKLVANRHNITSLKTEVDMSDFSNGAYIVDIRTSEQTEKHKVVLSH